MVVNIYLDGNNVEYSTYDGLVGLEESWVKFLK